MKKLMIALSVLAVSVCSVQAVVIASDAFVADATGDAPNGVYQHGGGNATDGVLKNSPNNNVVAQGFSGSWGGTGFATVQPGTGTDGHANIRMQNTVKASRSLSAYTNKQSGTYYFSMTVSADTLLSAAQSAYFGFSDDLDNLPEEGETQFGFLLGIESDGSSMNLIARTRQSDSSPNANKLKDTLVGSLNAGQEYNLLVRMDRNIAGGTDGFTLWVDPADSTEGNNTAALVFDENSSSSYYGFLNQDDINSFGLYSGGIDDENVANVTVDNVMMATTWNDVYTNVIPEPATVSLFAFSSGIVMILRRVF